jgi:hypothetical protein
MNLLSILIKTHQDDFHSKDCLRDISTVIHSLIADRIYVAKLEEEPLLPIHVTTLEDEATKVILDRKSNDFTDARKRGLFAPPDLLQQPHRHEDFRAFCNRCAIVTAEAILAKYDMEMAKRRSDIKPLMVKMEIGECYVEDDLSMGYSIRFQIVPIPPVVQSPLAVRDTIRTYIVEGIIRKGWRFIDQDTPTIGEPTTYFEVLHNHSGAFEPVYHRSLRASVYRYSHHVTLKDDQFLIQHHLRLVAKLVLQGIGNVLELSSGVIILGRGYCMIHDKETQAFGYDVWFQIKEN